MKKRLRDIWSRAAPGAAAAVRGAVRTVGKYLDDLCLAGAGICFVRAAHGLLGPHWATLVAGCCLTAYAVVVARSRGGNGGCC